MGKIKRKVCEGKPQKGCGGRDEEGPGEVSMSLSICQSSTRLSSCHRLPSSVCTINTRLDFLKITSLKEERSRN